MSTSMMLSRRVDECSSSSCRPLRCGLVSGVNLEFVRLAAIHLHEDYRPSRTERLTERIRSDGFLANPLLVSDAADRTFALDGHNRRECLRKAGCQFALVQRVALDDERQLAFREWFHVSQVESPDDFVAELKTYGLGITPMSAPLAELALGYGVVVCWISMWDQPDRVLAVSPGERQVTESLAIVTALYQPVRITLGDLPSGCLSRPGRVFQAQRKMNLFVRFAPIGREQVAAFVAADQRIPCGITRTVVLSGRAIGLNVPLELLRDSTSDADRHAWLEGVRHKSPAYYPGPTIVDEDPSPRRYDDPLLVYDPMILVHKPLNHPGRRGGGMSHSGSRVDRRLDHARPERNL